MSSVAAKRSNVLDQLLKKPAYEAELEDATEAYQGARARSRDAVMLSLRLASGTVESFPYAYLTRVQFLPGDTITLTFGDKTVEVTGRNLARLCETITEQRTRWVQEGLEGEEALKSPDLPHVDRIVISETEEL